LRKPAAIAAQVRSGLSLEYALGSKLNQTIEVDLQIRFKLRKELDNGERVLVERCTVGGD
jgi:hypothetical protein